MVNLLGDAWPENAAGGRNEPEWRLAFANAQLKMHLYGKQEARAGRKMGHFTVINISRDEAIKQALQVRSELNIGD